MWIEVSIIILLHNNIWYFENFYSFLLRVRAYLGILSKNNIYIFYHSTLIYTRNTISWIKKCIRENNLLPRLWEEEVSIYVRMLAMFMNTVHHWFAIFNWENNAITEFWLHSSISTMCNKVITYAEFLSLNSCFFLHHYMWKEKCVEVKYFYAYINRTLPTNWSIFSSKPTPTFLKMCLTAPK